MSIFALCKKCLSSILLRDLEGFDLIIFENLDKSLEHASAPSFLICPCPWFTPCSLLDYFCWKSLLLEESIKRYSKSVFWINSAINL